MTANDSDRDVESRASDRASGLIGLSVRAGLVVGLLDVAVFAARVCFEYHGFFRRTPHALWMIPISSVGLFAILGVALRFLVQPIPMVGRPLAAGLLCTSTLTACFLTIPGIRLASSLLLAIGLSSWIIPAVRSRELGRTRRLIRWSLVPLLLTIPILGAVSLGRVWMLSGGALTATEVLANAPNVLFIVMDTVRADATSLVDTGLDSTPRLAALAKQGTRFDRAIATCPWTLPSHASMFTGKKSADLNLGPNRGLDATYPTLAEYFGQNGYTTGGFVANLSFCTEEYGLNRGFGHYVDYVITPLEVFRSSALGWLIARRLTPIVDRIITASGRAPIHSLEMPYRKDAAEVNREAIRWIAAQGDQPYFAFLNYFDAHAPYLVPANVPRPFTGHTDTLAERRSLRDWADDTPRPHDPGDVRLAIDAYHDCIAYLDARIGDLIDELGRLGRLENTLIVITSDHGEHFGEHVSDGLPIFGHRRSVYEAEINVPLLIIAPGQLAGNTIVDRAVSLRDLPATIVDLAGLPTRSPFPGRTLFPPPGVAPGAAALSELSRNREDNPCPNAPADLSRALVSDGKSYLRHSKGPEELYDLKTDPTEQLDLSRDPAHAGQVDEFRAALDAPKTFD